jgi:DNA-binding MarR family transcriptional regulator
MKSARLLRVPNDSSTEIEELAHELTGRFDALTQEFLVPQLSAHLSRGEAAFLRLLHTEGTSTMTEVSSQLGMALSTATGLVDRLVERRFVERSRPEKDRRTVQVSLTSRGRRAYEALQSDRVRLGVALLERLSAQERQTLIQPFRKVTRKED